MGTVDFDFEDETVVVTGGSSGIGREVSLRFADAGAAVVIADVRERPRGDETTPTREAIEDASGTAAYVETDVSDPEQVADVVEAAREWGGVDVMVNNAGLYERVPFRKVSPETVDRLLAVNVRGVFFGCQAAANDMVGRDDPGVIVNTASISSTRAQREQIQYDLTKGAVGMITRGAALELAADGIRVNAVAPGIIATEFGSKGGPETAAAVERGSLVKPMPLGRAGAPRTSPTPTCF